MTRDSTTAHAAPQPVSAPLSGASRVLVLMPSWVGDVVMATPLLRAVRAARPSARIAALLRPGVAPMLDGSPWIDERFVARMKGAAGPWTGLGAARRFRADAVLLLPNSVRSGLAALALAPRRIGYRTPWRSFALTHSLAPPPRRAPVPAVDYYAELGEFALGEPIDDRRLELVVTEEQRRAAAVLLDDSGADDSRLGEDRARARRWLVVNPGANRIDKRWPAERFAEVAARLAIEHGLEVAVTGAPGERAIVASVVSSARERLARASAPGSAARAPTSSSAPRVVDLVERGVTLGSLKGVLAHASLLVTNDTGPRHVAAALGTPSVVLFGPTDHRWTTLASSAPRDRLLLSEPFLPDDRMADRLPGVCRIERISVGDAIDAARVLLTRQSGPRRGVTSFPASP